MALTLEDRVLLQDLMGRYCLMVDAADEGWADLFVEDGVLDGIYPEPLIGREALRVVPRNAREGSGGFWRHHLTSVAIDEAAGGARLRAYNLVTDWRDGGKLVMNARYNVEAVRTPEGWRLKRVYAALDR
ncbi:MAG TPA: nuclear transport factor 2 family protein [Phenylobacterium sp.]|uniref:nuclear transport factor 2 family protein n=1 Tax=Phenylobacterium sp. TaxID=1871053 RepID=UPI002B4A3932|nr:nuclear transport factor 2 family protein [Phenylobacterium sp.]HKR25136.1 nuclear transport factor 2 family protein [Allosphingosinicella sp.]HKR87472.1 nuclear transport factor 2 family protein [Phenylobacterium sp.]